MPDTVVSCREHYQNHDLLTFKLFLHPYFVIASMSDYFQSWIYDMIEIQSPANVT